LFPSPPPKKKKKHQYITAPNDSPNTDGFDPDSSRNVLIEHSTYAGGDDCVAIKSGWDCKGIEYGKATANVHVRNLTCSGRYAGVAVGSEVSGGVFNVTVEGVRFVRRRGYPLSCGGVGHVKWGASRGGAVRNVSQVISRPFLYQSINLSIYQSINLSIDQSIYTHQTS
jgi:polygalacturonase